jgi:uncharacterized protein (DUF2147 family)
VARTKGLLDSRPRRRRWELAAGLIAVAVLGAAGPALALPANPWTGNWRTSQGDVVTLTQSGSQITGTSLCPSTTSLPGITYTATASGDGSVATFAYMSVVCTGVGGTFTGTMSADGKTVTGSGTTQYGTGFSFSWTYEGGGIEPRAAPPPPPPPPAPAARCPGGPFSGLWTARGNNVFSFTQSGTALSGTLLGQQETISGTVSGSTADAVFTVPEGSGTWHLTLAPDGGSFTTTGTTTTGVAFGPLTSAFIGCPAALQAVNLQTTIPAPQTIQGGPTTIVAPSTVSLTSLTRSKCVLVKLASRRPARMLVSIFSGRRSIRLFGQKRVVFLAAGRRSVCIPVPFRAHTFNLRTQLNVALGYVVGAQPRAGERKPAPVIRRISLVP